MATLRLFKDLKGKIMENLKISCPCHFGLESVLSGEMKRLGFADVTSDNGKVSFSGGLSDVAKANINLRTAERVLLELASFTALSFEELFQGVRAIPWEDFICVDEAFPVKGWSLNSKLHSVPDCQSIIKKAVVRRLEGKYGISIFPETGAKHQIQFSILKDKVCIYFDTSGEGLHKRGYRRNSNAAPIKETLAAGILDIARVKGESTVYDPMCGSGTFLIESFLRATKTAPGLRRYFAAENWKIFDKSIFKEARAEALDKIDRSVSFKGFGSDIDADAVRLSIENSKKANAENRLSFKQMDVKDFSLTDGGIVICNPPYGERLSDIRTAEAIYREMGRVFERKSGVNYYIITPHEEFESLFGRKADKRRKLYNGMIKCTLYQYFL